MAEMNRTNEERDGMPLKRREFLMMAAGAGLALVLPASALADGAKWVSVGKAAQFVKDKPQQVILPDNGGTILVTRSGKKLTALSAVCTHKGGILKWDETEKAFVCPLHAAAFGLDGKNVKGTRKHPDEKLPNLATVPVKEKKGEVLVDVSALPVAAPKPEEKPAPSTP